VRGAHGVDSRPARGAHQQQGKPPSAIDRAGPTPAHADRGSRDCGDPAHHCGRGRHAQSRRVSIERARGDEDPGDRHRIRCARQGPAALRRQCDEHADVQGERQGDVHGGRNGPRLHRCRHPCDRREDAQRVRVRADRRHGFLFHSGASHAECHANRHAVTDTDADCGPDGYPDPGRHSDADPVRHAVTDAVSHSDSGRDAPRLPRRHRLWSLHTRRPRWRRLRRHDAGRLGARLTASRVGSGGTAHRRVRRVRHDHAGLDRQGAEPLPDHCRPDRPGRRDRRAGRYRPHPHPRRDHSPSALPDRRRDHDRAGGCGRPDRPRGKRSDQWDHPGPR